MKSLHILAVIPAKAGIHLIKNGCPTEELGHDDKGESEAVNRTLTKVSAD